MWTMLELTKASQVANAELIGLNPIEAAVLSQPALSPPPLLRQLLSFLLLLVGDDGLGDLDVGLVAQAHGAGLAGDVRPSS